jgi:hypothetical protein
MCQQLSKRGLATTNVSCYCNMHTIFTLKIKY